MNRCALTSTLSVAAAIVLTAMLLSACADSGGSGTTPPGVLVGSADSTAPSQPGSLTATAMSSSQINLTWMASTDNVAVTGYKIFRGGVQIATSLTNSYSHTGLTPSTNYSYTVSAYDAAGNNSPQSGSANATTQVGGGNGTVVNAATCSQADVQSAVNAAADGNTVMVPNGTCTWSTPVRLSNAKGVTLRCQTAGSCLISLGGTAVLFDTLTGINAHFYRISGFTFRNNPGQNYIIWIAAVSTGTLTQVRIDHNTFANLTAGSIAILFGHTQAAANYYGVIDHNTVTNPNTVTFFHWIGQENPAPPPSQFGTANNMFLEDNTISITTMTNAGAGCTDSWGGAAVVFRHNSTLNCLVASHGTVHAGGPQNWEVYENTLRVDAGSVAQGVADGYRLFHHQGSGEFVAFNNSFTAFSGKTDSALEMTHYRSATPLAAGYGDPPGRCDGSKAIDGNRTPVSTYFGYPCWRQPGRDFVGNLKPMYVWNNRWSDTGAKINLEVSNPWSATNPGVEDHIKPERDYYNAVSALAQTSSTNPFNGTTGMGFGSLANRSTTCTTNASESGGGVGYFATDQGPQGTLYRCSATNTWTTWYQPYTYPHPLVTGP
jgi:hypothetical protein